MTKPPPSSFFRPLLIVTTLALPMTLTGCSVPASSAASSAPARAEPIVRVATAAVTERSVARTLSLTGTLTANRESGVAADANGKVAATLVERGSVVRKGAPLVRLDRRSAQLAASEAHAQSLAAQAQATLARSECQRAETLFAAQAINRAEYDRTRAQCEAAGQAAAAAHARQGLASKTLGDLIVRAPFAGVVADRFVNEGEYVRPDTRVATVVELDRLRLELAVPEQALGSFASGADVQFTVAAFPGQTFRGRVRYVGAQVRRATRDLLVEAAVDNADGKLRPGMFAVAEIPVGNVPALVVPASAVRRGEHGAADRVFVVVDGHAQERLVRLGRMNVPEADWLPVLDGVRGGEPVVVSPPADLKDGVRVN